MMADSGEDGGAQSSSTNLLLRRVPIVIPSKTCDALCSKISVLLLASCLRSTCLRFDVWD